MRCSDAIHLMAGYVDQTLPDASAKAMKIHLQHCEDCHTEYVIWKESSVFFKQFDDSAAFPAPESHSDMAEGVMARLAKEDKWSFPITTNVFHLPPVAKRWISSLCVLFLLVFGVMMFGTFQAEDSRSSMKSDWKEMTSSKVVMSLDKLRANSSEESAGPDIRYKIISSIGDPLVLSHGAGSSPAPNAGLITGFFGIMITVVTMSWLSRA